MWRLPLGERWSCSLPRSLHRQGMPPPNIARLIPSLFPRPAPRPIIPRAAADARGCYQTGAAQTGTRLRLHVGHNHGKHLFMNVNSRYLVGHKLLLAAAESVPQVTLNWVAGYRRSPGRDNAHLFAQPRTLRIRLIDSLDFSIVGNDLAAPNLVVLCLTLSNFHELSRAARR
jgi:hypothetical protein